MRGKHPPLKTRIILLTFFSIQYFTKTGDSYCGLSRKNNLDHQNYIMMEDRKPFTMLLKIQWLIQNLLTGTSISEEQKEYFSSSRHLRLKMNFKINGRNSTTKNLMISNQVSWLATSINKTLIQFSLRMLSALFFYHILIVKMLISRAEI